jgi:hypothetical protein
MQLKHHCFVSDIVVPNPHTLQIETISPALQKPEKIKHILIGSHKAVTITMQVLQQLGYADIKDWSPLLPTHNPGEFISVLIKAVAVQ